MNDVFFGQERTQFRKWIIGISTALILGTMSLPSFCQTVSKVIFIGKSEIIKCRKATRAAIGDPNVADIAALSPDEILINGKTCGSTVLYIWDRQGETEYDVKVRTTQVDIVAARSAIEREINDSRVTVRSVGDSIILSGKVGQPSESQYIQTIAESVVRSYAGYDLPVVTKQKEPAIVPIADETGKRLQNDLLTDANQPSTGVAQDLLPRVVNLIQVDSPLDNVSNVTVRTAAAIRGALNNPAMTVRALPGSVVTIEGIVGTQDEFNAIDNLTRAWMRDDKSGNLADRVTIVNSVQVNSSTARQVMVRAEIMDVDSTASKDLGLEWGRVLFSPGSANGINMTANVVDQPFLIGQTGGGPFDSSNGSFSMFDPIGAQLHALQQNNKARTLAKPNMLVLDGREADMLVGGELPIPVVQAAGGGASGSTITVQYKEFGVKLHMTPVITGSSTVQLKIATEVSSVTATNAVVINGFSIPAIQTRREETIVNVKNGQSLVIGGLMQNQKGQIITKIPVLADIPILGEFFKYKNWTNQETELVIMLTPTIMQPSGTAGK
jgi:Flp pilus assembly secretin CpaC